MARPTRWLGYFLPDGRNGGLATVAEVNWVVECEMDALAGNDARNGAYRCVGYVGDVVIKELVVGVDVACPSV